MSAVCNVEGCNKPVYYRQPYCKAHYEKWRMYGDPMVTKYIRNNDEARFFSYVDKNGPNGCWIWTGAINGAGYGSFYYKGRQVKAARWIYEQMVGPIPDGLVLDHYVCNNPRCVNPNHLRPCTQKKNVLRGFSPPAKNAKKTHCPQGHPYSEENTRLDKYGGRHCKICDAMHDEGRPR